MTKNRHALGMTEFLNHKGSGKGGGQYLDNWKDNKRILVYLHTQSSFIPYWFHGWSKVIPFEDRETGSKGLKVIPHKFGCLEKESILKKQSYRDDDDARELPPEVCPMCIYIEHVRKLVRSKAISWVDEVLKFEGDDPEKMVVCHAGGIYKHFSKDDLDKAEIAELRQHHINRKDSFKENLYARMNYVFAVVNAEAPEGVQVAQEAPALGDKLKFAIRDEIAKLRSKQDPDGRAGNPMLNPYPFEWLYDDSQNFDKKYHVRRGPILELTDDIRDLITDAEQLPDLEAVTTQGNCVTLRSELETHSTLDLPWDEIFAPAKKAGLMKMAESAEKHDRVPEVGKYSEADAATEAAEAEAKAEEDDGITCDHCDAPMADDDVVCASCGATYEEVNGVLALGTRPCLNPECDKQVDVAGAETKDGAAVSICGKCATIHEVRDGVWGIVKPAAKPAAKRAAKATPKVEPEKKPAAKRTPKA
jgi:hypothetical protein